MLWCVGSPVSKYGCCLYDLIDQILYGIKLWRSLVLRPRLRWYICVRGRGGEGEGRGGEGLVL